MLGGRRIRRAAAAAAVTVLLLGLLAARSEAASIDDLLNRTRGGGGGGGRGGEEPAASPKPEEGPPRPRILASFESNQEWGQWRCTPSSHAKRSPARTTHGNWSARLLGPARFALPLRGTEIPTNWSAYDTVTLSLYNPQAYPIVVRLELRGGGFVGAAHRESITVPAAGSASYTLPLTRVRESIRRSITQIVIVIERRRRPDVIFADNLRLVKHGSVGIPFVIPAEEEPQGLRRPGGNRGGRGTGSTGGSTSLPTGGILGRFARGGSGGLPGSKKPSPKPKPTEKSRPEPSREPAMPGL